VHPQDALQQKGEKMMAREKNGDSVKGIKRIAPFRCVAVKCVHPWDALQQKGGKKNYGQREGEIR
jgi:hypothetical protein